MPKRTKPTLAQLRRVCESLPGTTEDVKWGDHAVFSVGGKMYAIWGGRDVSFKVHEPLMHELTALEGVYPAPYLARHHWVAFNYSEGSALTKKQFESLIRDSHKQVLGKLSKKKQREILGE